MPTLMLAITTPGLKGMTAQATRASVKVTSGATTNTTELAPLGTMVSLTSSLTPSAKGCNRPKGPTTLGPLRSCENASTLRSAYVNMAIASSNGTTTAITSAAVITVGQA